MISLRQHRELELTIVSLCFAAAGRSVQTQMKSMRSLF